MGAKPVLLAAAELPGAAADVVAWCKQQFLMQVWAVTLREGDQQRWLAVDDQMFGRRPGDLSPWSTSMCRQLLSDSPVAFIADVRADPRLDLVTRGVRCYLGAAIRQPDGLLLGSICGMDPEPRGPELTQQLPLLSTFASLLSAALSAEIRFADLDQQLAAARQLSETDPMTRVANRRGWQLYLQHEEDRCRRFDDPAAILILDLDELKSVNDSNGHAAGDAHIELASRVLSETVRATDFVARLGGDEFGVLAARTTPEQVAGLVRRLRSAFRTAGVPVSIGCATYDSGDGFAGTWRRADAAMYVDKRGRRRRHQRVSTG